MRVLWVLEDAGRLGGVESVVRVLHHGLRDRGLDSAVHSWRSDPLSLQAGRRTGTWLHDKVIALRRRQASEQATARWLCRELKSDRRLVVLLDPGSLGVAKHLSGCPRWGLHVHWSPDLILRPWRHLAGEAIPGLLAPLVSARMRRIGARNSRLLRSAPFLVSLSRSHTVALKQMQPRVHEIPNPIGPCPVIQRAALPPGSVVTVGYVGRFSWEKGPDVLVDALALIGSCAGKTRAVFAGSGPLEQALRERVQTRGLDSVSFLGWVNEPQALLAQLEVLVLPSRVEAFSLVLVEALAAGCLVVAADAGSGVRDVLYDGRLGTIVPKEDPAALASAIEQAVLETRAGRHADLSLVTELTKRHDPAAVIDAWIELIDERGAGTL